MVGCWGECDGDDLGDGGGIGGGGVRLVVVMGVGY